MECIQINQEKRKKKIKVTTKFAVLWKEKGLFFRARGWTNTFPIHMDAQRWKRLSLGCSCHPNPCISKPLVRQIKRNSSCALGFMGNPEHKPEHSCAIKSLASTAIQCFSFPSRAFLCSPLTRHPTCSLVQGLTVFAGRTLQRDSEPD